MAQSIQNSRPITGRSVFLAIVGFFSMVFAVNGLLLSQALRTNSGLVANEPYRKGLKYNERIAADEHQSELGWQTSVAISPDGQNLVASLTTPAGDAITGKTVTITIGRPATDREDFNVQLKERLPGRYEAGLLVPAKGAYIANLEVSESTEDSAPVVYRARRRLWVTP